MHKKIVHNPGSPVVTLAKEMLLKCGFMMHSRPKYTARTSITLLKGGEGRGSLSITDS